MPRSIRSQVVALGEQEWRRSRETADWREWRGCQLVNPLCPDDLCILPGGHVGTEQGYHILGTTPWDNPLRLTKKSIMFLADGGLGQNELINLGCAEQGDRFPDG